MFRIDLHQKELQPDQIFTLQKMWIQSVSDIINCTSLAACGHPGGSMSSLHFLLMLYGIANIHPENRNAYDRDRVIISHGHITPGIYSVLARYDFFDSEEMVLNFRKLGSRFSGHVETGVPGIEWNTGNLGQGMSNACGLALFSKINHISNKTIVCMGDGEQQKGQISEARRAAVKFKLANLIAIVDYNRLQIGGSITDVMPQNIIENYRSDGWNVLFIENGHDFEQIFQVFKKVWNNEVENKDHPTVIIAKTQMGHGVSFMNNMADYHGRACTDAEYKKAMAELKLPDILDSLRAKRKALPHKSCPPQKESAPVIRIDKGSPIVYGPEVMTDNRSAYGTTLADLAKKNNFDVSKNKIAGVSCDLEGSVKMNSFRKVSPELFFECGIQEHHASTMAGALSKGGLQTFFSTFGVFGVDEVFNQQRLNAINKTNIKTVCTHLGLSVGEDGPTHQCITYIGLLRSIPNYSIFIPADPNQTDHIIRHVASVYGNCFVGMGRAKVPVITNEKGEPFFGKDYTFQPGKADVLTQGKDVTVVTLGALLDYALKVAKKLDKENIHVRVINMASVIPYDGETLVKAARETGALLTVEDHYVHTGIGSILDEILVANRITIPVKHLGVHSFAESGTPEELYHDQGMGMEGIESSIKELLKIKSLSGK